MADEKNKPTNRHAPAVPFDNKVDYVYGFRAVPATTKTEGETLEVVAYGFDLTKLADSAAFADFEAYAKSHGHDSVAGVMQGYLANRATKPKYAKPVEGQTLADCQKEAQKALDDFKVGQRASTGAKAETKAKAALGSEIERMAAEAGMPLADFMAAMKDIAARKAKPKK